MSYYSYIIYYLKSKKKDNVNRLTDIKACELLLA